MALDGILLGSQTFLDTHDTEVLAWEDALTAAGFTVPKDRVGAALSAYPEQMVAVLLGARVDAREGARIRAARKEAFLKRIAQLPRGARPGAVPLLRDLRRRGVQLAFFGTWDTDERLALERACGLSFEGEVDFVALSPLSVRHSIRAGLAGLSMSGAQCAIFAHARFLVRAAARAGVVSIGLPTRHTTRFSLRELGSRAIYVNPQELLSDLDRALRVASPAKFQLDERELQRLMDEALTVARENLKNLRTPHGAIVVSSSGEIRGRGRDLSETHGPLAHAEMDALRAALPYLGRDTGSVLVSTRAPCRMCMFAAMQSNVDTIVFGSGAMPRVSALARTSLRTDWRSVFPRVVRGVRAEESRELRARFRALDAAEDAESAESAPPVSAPPVNARAAHDKSSAPAASIRRAV